MPTLTHCSAPATLWADPHPPKGRHWGWVCEVGGTSYWAVPHQYPPPQPTHTDPCKYLMLQKTEEPRHLPESGGQIPLSRSFSGAASALSQLPRSPPCCRAHCAEQEGCKTSPTSQLDPRELGWGLQGNRGVPAHSSPLTHCSEVKPKVSSPAAANSLTQRGSEPCFRQDGRGSTAKNGEGMCSNCPEPSRGCEVGNGCSSHMGSSQECIAH